MNIVKCVRAYIVLTLLLVITTPASAQDGFWNVDAGGNWSTTSNWLGGTIADGADATANFTFNITDDRIITLDANRTLGNLNFSDGGAGGSVWRLDGPGTLTLQRSSGTPTITTNTVTVINTVLAGNQGLSHSGDAALILAADNTYTGLTTIAADGLLQFGNGGTTGSITGNMLNEGRVYFNYASGTLKGYGGAISGAGAVQFDAGTTWLTGANSYSGETRLNSGVLRTTAGAGLSNNSNLVFSNGGVYESSGTFTRVIGTGAGQVRWEGSGGFSAAGLDLTVNIGGAGQTLTWGQTNFVPDGAALVLGSVTADAKVTIANPLNFNGQVRTIQVNDNAGASTDLAALSGAFSNGGLTKTGTGTLGLSGIGSSVTELNVNAGALEVTGSLTAANTYAGREAGSTGALTVKGAGALLTASLVRIGESGTGTLRVEAGGVVTNSGISRLGLNAGSSGTAVVTGAGSQWNTTGLLDVGNAGSGALTVEAGGVVRSDGGFIGRVTGSSGAATVTGAGSQWIATGDIFVAGTSVGDGGPGSLTVSDGGAVGARSLTVRSAGTVKIDGGSVTAQSFDRSAGTFQFDDGSVTISGGAYLHSTAMGTSSNVLELNGSGVGDTAAMILDGNFATTGVQALVVGTSHGGSLELSGGRALNLTGTNTVLATIGGVGITVGDAYVGLSAGSTGALTVKGSGSSLTADIVRIGQDGHGTLRVESGGVVTNSGISRMGFNAGSSGSATVTGAGSQWNITSFIDVGNEGSGTLNVEAGGVVRSAGSFIGRAVGSSGTATVTGTGSQWISTGDLWVGGTTLAAAGVGSLTVEAGGSVMTPTILKLWSTGTLTVNGGSVSAQTFDPSAGTFNFDHGTVTVNGGVYTHSTATNTAANLLELNGGAAGDNPTLKLVGNAANVGLQGVVVGSTRTATLEISGGRVVDLAAVGTSTAIGTIAGGEISGGDLHLGLTAGSSGTLTVKGAGSGLTTDLLRVGQGGTGTMRVESGAVVTTRSGPGLNSGIGRIGVNAGSSGSATVTGAGSQWNITSEIDVGSGGTGTLMVEAAGVVRSGNGFVARSTGSSGAATVSGAGSQWIATGGIYVGGNNSTAGGTGSLTIAQAGAVSASQAFKLWSGGTVTINGGTLTAQSLDRAAGTFNFQNGTVTVNGGAYTHSTAMSTAANILVLNGFVTGDVATMQLQGNAATTGVEAIVVGSTHGGALEISGGRTIAIAGTADTLGNVGGVNVHRGETYLGVAVGSAGELTITGAGSQLSQSSVIAVGYSGGGTLNVAAGGKFTNTNAYLGFNSTGEGVATVNRSVGVVVGELRGEFGFPFGLLFGRPFFFRLSASIAQSLLKTRLAEHFVTVRARRETPPAANLFTGVTTTRAVVAGGFAAPAEPDALVTE